MKTIDNIISEAIHNVLAEKKGEKNPEETKETASDSKKEKQTIKFLSKTFDDETNTYSLTRSQIAYQLYPDISKDAARSKLSQKINGLKKFKPWEINRIYAIIDQKFQ